MSVTPVSRRRTKTLGHPGSTPRTAREDNRRDRADSHEGREDNRRDRADSHEGREDNRRDREDNRRDREDNRRDREDNRRDREDNRRDREDSHRDREDSHRDREDSHRDREDSHRDREDNRRDRVDSHSGVSRVGGPGDSHSVNLPVNSDGAAPRRMTASADVHCLRAAVAWPSSLRVGRFCSFGTAVAVLRPTHQVHPSRMHPSSRADNTGRTNSRTVGTTTSPSTSNRVTNSRPRWSSVTARVISISPCMARTSSCQRVRVRRSTTTKA